MDNTCDGFTDEGQLTGGASTDLSSGFAHAVRADYSPARNEIGVVYRVSPPGGVHDLWFARVDTSGRVLATPVLLGPCYAFALDVAWDGNHWTVAGDTPSGDGISLYRVEAGTDRVFAGPVLAPSLSGNGFHTVAIDRIRGSSEVALATAESGVGRARVHRVTAPAAASSPLSIGDSAAAWPASQTGFASSVAVTDYPGGAYAFITRQYGSPVRHEIRFVRVTSSGFGLITALFDSEDDQFQIEAAYEGTRNYIGFVYGTRSSSGVETRALNTLNADTSVLIRSWNLPLSAPTYITSASDGSFAIASGNSVSRHRATDLTPFSDVVTAGTANIYAIEGVTDAPVATDPRYVVFGNGNVPATPVICR